MKIPHDSIEPEKEADGVLAHSLSLAIITR